MDVDYVADTRAHIDANNFDVVFSRKQACVFVGFLRALVAKIFTFLAGSSFVHWYFKSIFFRAVILKFLKKRGFLRLVRQLNKKGLISWL